MTDMTVQTKPPVSQFAYVVLAARRARQLMAGAPPLTDNVRTTKPTRIACEEVDQGLIEYEFNADLLDEESKDGSKRKK
jgi:DNA-directed RNA polymerase omega subunit